MPAAERQCPGQNTMFWRPEDIYDVTCPDCGYSIEFFKTDLKLQCPQCGQKVLNPKVDFSCAEWCEQAEQCVGPATYSEIVEKRELERRRKTDLERLLSIIPSHETEVKVLFQRLYQENTDPSRLFDVRALGLLRGKNRSLVDRARRYYRQFAKQKS